MSPKTRYDDPFQLHLWDDGDLDAHMAASQRIYELASQPPEPPKPAESEESEAEFYVEVAAAARIAIKQTGLSREQVLDRVNSMFGRSRAAGEAGGAADGRKKPLSLPMFNNYLSKPHDNPLPAWLIHAIAVVCASDEPVRALLRPGSIIVGAEEQTELLLGKVDQQIRDMQSLKRSVARQLRAKRSGGGGGSGEEGRGREGKCGATPS